MEVDGDIILAPSFVSPINNCSQKKKKVALIALKANSLIKNLSIQTKKLKPKILMFSPKKRLFY